MKTIKVIALIAAILFAGMTYAQRGEFRGQRGNFQDRREIVKEFRQQNPEAGLTQAQREQLKNQRIEAEKKIKPFQDELRELRAKHQTLVTADKPDLKAIENSLEKLANVQLSMAKIRAAQHQEIRAQLNDEQRLIFDKRHQMGKGRGHFRPQRGM
jgi:Spy/CpxP family protein refolding chaperone